MVNNKLVALSRLEKIPKDIKLYNRYQIIALAQGGTSNNVIANITGSSKEIVSRWRQRDMIHDNQRADRPLVYSEATQLKTTAFYCQTKPLLSHGRWTLRTAGKYIENDPALVGLPVSHSTIHRFLQKQALKPHRSKYFLQITDPDFFPKMERLIQLYLKPPAYLFNFDECPGIQILQRLAPDLQTEETKIRLEEFEYIRNGTMDVFAFLNFNTGKVFAKCRADHKIATLLEVFEKHLQTLPEKEPLHYVMDNLASHASYELCELVAKYSHIKCPSNNELDKVDKRRQWLQAEDKRIIFHFTPFHGSWLNVVEIWFGILNQKCLKESYDSPELIREAIYEIVDTLWNSLMAHPFTWKYDGKGLKQIVVNRFIKMLEFSSHKLNIKFMTKQFLLMQNLINDKQARIKHESWYKLNELVCAKQEHFNTIIINDDGPRRKINAQIALENLIDSLKQFHIAV